VHAVIYLTGVHAVALCMQLMLSGSDQLLSIQGSAMSIMGEEGHHHYEYITSDGRTVTSCSEVPAAMLPAEGSEEDQLGDHQQQRQIKRAGDEDVLILDEIGGRHNRAVRASVSWR
jgi:hypothetical protein